MYVYIKNKNETETILNNKEYKTPKGTLRYKKRQENLACKNFTSYYITSAKEQIKCEIKLNYIFMPGTVKILCCR